MALRTEECAIRTNDKAADEIFGSQHLGHVFLLLPNHVEVVLTVEEMIKTDF
jgi:hypothetical protein